MPSVNPEILRWARETAGMTPDVAASKLSLNDTKRATKLDRLAALENGEDEPSDAMLLRMAKAYRRPLLSFYLPAPPEPDRSSLDFRTLPERSSADEPVVASLLRDVKARQALVRGLLEEEDQSPLAFVGSSRGATSVESVLASVVGWSGISRDEFRRAKNTDEAFSYLRERFEAIGIYIVLLSNLGTHHTDIDVRAFRGIALSDPFAPFVVINSQDAKSAWSFTLLHEVCHLWLGESGISTSSTELASERFCNEVASAFLLSTEEIGALSLPASTAPSDLADAMSAFAAARNISTTLVAFRAFQAGRISEESWTSVAEYMRTEWRRQKQTEKDARKDRAKDGGPNFYVVRRYRLGKALVETAYRGVMEGSLSPSKAAKILGVAPRSVYPLLNTANGRAA